MKGAQRFACALLLGVLILTLASLPLVAAAFTVGEPEPEPEPEPKPPTAGDWLQAAARHEGAGEHAQAGEAYESAFESFSLKYRRGAEGARAAVLAAHAHWEAFALDMDLAHLERGIHSLEQWVDLMDLDDIHSDVFGEVNATLSNLQAIEHALSTAKALATAGDYEEASRYYLDAFAVIERAASPSDSSQARKAALFDPASRSFYAEGWTIGVQIATRVAEERIGAYENDADSADTDQTNERKGLMFALSLLTHWEDRWATISISRETESSLNETIIRVRAMLRDEAVAPPAPQPPSSRRAWSKLPAPKASGNRLLIAAGAVGALSWAAWGLHSRENRRCVDASQANTDPNSLFLIQTSSQCATIGDTNYNSRLMTGTRLATQGFDITTVVLASAGGILRGRHDAARDHGERRPRRFRLITALGIGTVVATGALHGTILQYENTGLESLCDFTSGAISGFCMSSMTVSALRQLSSFGLAAGIALTGYGLTYRAENRTRAVIGMKAIMNGLSVAGRF